MREQFVLLLVFLAAVLLNLVIEAYRRRLRRPAAPPREPVAERVGAPAPPPPAVTIPPPPRPRPRPMAPAPSPPRALGAPRRRRLLAGPSDARRAMILMAILGPCRGLESRPELAALEREPRRSGGGR
jgi:hypothetical protein